MDDPAEEQRLRADHAARVQESVNFQPGGREKLTDTHDPQHALQKSGGFADQWCMDDGDIKCRPTQVLSFLQDVNVANARVGAEQNPLKTEVIYYVNDLDTAAPEWRIGDVRSLAKTSAVTAGIITLGVAVGSRQFITDQLLGKADVIRAMHERVPLCQDPQTESALLRESLGVSRTNHILRVHGHTILQEQRAAAVYYEIGQRSLERLFPGLTEDSMTQATLSAGQSGIAFTSARDIAAPAHLGAPTAAQPRIQTMTRDAVRAGLLPKQILETRLSEPPAPPISAHSTTTSKPRQGCMFRRKPRRQTKPGSKLSRDSRTGRQTRPSHLSDTQAPPLGMKTATTWTSKRPGRAVSVGRSSKRSFYDSLVGLVSGA